MPCKFVSQKEVSAMTKTTDRIVSKPTTNNQIVALVLRILISGTFLVAAISKLFDLSGFQQSLAANEWLPGELITPEMRQNDPPMQSRMALPPLSGLDVSKLTFVVILSGCSLCSLGGIVPAEQLGRQFRTNVVLISPNPLDKMQTFAHDNQLSALLYSDAKQRYTKIYNATWRPRIYLLNRTKKLGNGLNKFVSSILSVWSRN